MIVRKQRKNPQVRIFKTFLYLCVSSNKRKDIVNKKRTEIIRQILKEQMRVLLKKGDKFYSIYYIKRCKGNNCIVGWFSEKRLVKKIFPEIETVESDIHFTYHADGNYHTSLKYQDESLDHIERRLFHDKIVVKNLTKRTVESFQKTDISPFEGLLSPNFKATPFADRNLLFTLTSTGFDLSSDSVLKGFTDTNNQPTAPRKDDLVIDLEIDNNYFINVSATLMGDQFVQPLPTNPNFKYDKNIEVIDKSNSPFIKLYVLFHLNKDNNKTADM